MKKLVLLIITLTMVLCWASAGWTSTTFDLMHDYGVNKYQPTQGDGPLKHDAVKLKDWNDSRFADEFDLSNYLIDGLITMEIRHRGNGHKHEGATTCCTEKWHFVAYSSIGAGNDPYYNESTKLAPCLDRDIQWLSFSGGKWVTDSFEIDPAAVKLDNFRLLFAEETCGKDKMDLDYVKLSFKGSAVPVPAAVWLLGSGLAGLFGIRKRIRG